VPPDIKTLPRILSNAALEYAKRGWRVIPLHHVREYGESPVCSCIRRHECLAIAKHPRISGWRHVGTTDQKLISLWWKAWPLANVGVLMGGEARLITIDIDGAEGWASLEKLKESHGEMPITLTQTTGRPDGGEHRLFRVPQALGDTDYIRNRIRIADGIDVRSEGGLIVATPSVHYTGVSYRWRDPNVAIADLPQWFFKLATSARSRQALTPNGTRPPEEQLPPRADRIKWAREALHKEAEPAISGHGGSNACLRAVILIIRGYCLLPEDAFDLLWQEYNPTCIPPWSVEELQHKIDSVEHHTNDVPWRYKMSTVGGSIIDALIREGRAALTDAAAMSNATPETSPAPIAELKTIIENDEDE